LVEVVVVDGSEAWRAVDAGDAAPGLLDVGPITESQGCNVTSLKNTAFRTGRHLLMKTASFDFDLDERKSGGRKHKLFSYAQRFDPIY